MRSNRWPAVLLAVLTLLLGPLTQPASAAQGRPFTNPLKTQKGADPWIEFHNGNYYMITTSWTDVLTMRKSPTLAGLAHAPSVQVWKDTDTSRGCNFWAPELHSFNGKWYLYYVGGRCTADYIGTQRSHVLESEGSDPMGPYHYKNKLKPTGSDPWLIDPSVLEVGGKLYMLGSGDTTGTQNLTIAPMSNPYTVSGPLTNLSRPTLSWERSGTGGQPVNEGAVALQRDGKTFVVYSAAHCATPDYKLGQLELTGADPLNPAAWTKKSTPVFQHNSAAGVHGPGHNGFFTSPDGTENWMVYHARNDTSTNGCDNFRTTRAQKFTWNADGSPHLGVPVAAGVTLPGPSGETAATPTAYTLVNRNSGKCLDVAGGNSADVMQWTCGGSADQKWRIEDQADDTSRLINVATGKALDVAGCSTADGADIQQWSWLNNTCQRFRLIHTATSDYVRIVNANSGKVADVADCSTANDGDVRQWTWLNNTCQQWQFKPTT